MIEKVNVVDRPGRSPLHYAAASGDEATLVELIKSGADVSLTDCNGWTPLHFAAQSGSVEVARVLLEHGATVDARDQHGNTPLWRAVFNSRGDGVLISLLRSFGADPYASNVNGNSPLTLARTIANYDVARHFGDLDS